MLRKLLAALGIASTSATLAAPPYAPYTMEAANAIYNLLFCDSEANFLAEPGKHPTAWQAALASNPPDAAALARIAADNGEEGRIRYLAYQRLRQSGGVVPAKQLLGVVVEVQLPGGLDTLAAYSDGGVRYLNQSGKMAVIDGAPSFAPLVQGLFAASQPVVNTIGPWHEHRRAPPTRGNVRLTFLVSDGLYFGEGSMERMQQEPMAAPVIRKATELLQAVVAESTKGH